MSLPDCNCINNGVAGVGPCKAEEKTHTLENGTVVRYCNGPKVNLTITLGVNKPRIKR